MTIPALPRGVRLKHDKVRDTQVLLGPERTLMLDAIGAAILGEVDGARSVEEISACLAERYKAPLETIRGDVDSFLRGLADKRLLELRP